MVKFSTQKIHILFFLILNALSVTVLAQKTIYTVPTSEIVESQQLFCQQQFNVTDEIQSMTNFTYGLGGGWEAGIGLGNLLLHTHRHERFIRLEEGKPEENPRVVLNIQKGFDLTNWLKLGLGNRFGPTVAPRMDKVTLANFSFVSSQFTPVGTDAHIHLGSYFANQAFTGNGNHWGGMLAADIPLVPDKLRFEGEWVTGKNSLSLAILGLSLVLPKEWQLAVAMQFPSPGSPNSRGLVVQISSP